MTGQMVSYRGPQKQRKRRTVGNELVQALADVALRQVGKGAKVGAEWLYNGIASAFRTNGNNGSKQEMKAMVAPLAKSIQLMGKAPKYTNVSGGIRIEHTEPLAMVNGANHIVTNSETFTWLAPMASGFEEYRIQYEVGWVPTCPATTSGRAMLAFDYDPTDTGGYGVNQATDYLNTADHCVSAVWSPCVISPKQSAWLKTGTTGDARLFSPGTIHFAVADVTLGLLLVRYRVEFRKPQPSATRSYLQRGFYNVTAGLFSGVTETQGGSAFDISDVLLVQKYPGKFQVTWSTDGTVTSITNGGTVASTTLTTATNGNRIITWYTSGVGQTIAFFPTPFPVGDTSYKLEIVPIIENPVYGLT